MKLLHSKEEMSQNYQEPVLINEYDNGAISVADLKGNVKFWYKKSDLHSRVHYRANQRCYWALNLTNDKGAVIKMFVVPHLEADLSSSNDSLQTFSVWTGCYSPDLENNTWHEPVDCKN